MIYNIKLHPKVVKFLNKLDIIQRGRILTKIKLLKLEPFSYLQHYEGDDYYKLRIGDYRALINVDQARSLIFVRFLDHRSRVYKRRFSF